jgi:sarcosine oxidase subunit gamma
MAETTLRPLGARAQIDVRARAGALARVASALGIPALPGPNRFVATGEVLCFWLGPDEWLVLGPEASRPETLAALERSVGAEDGAAVDISASRVLYELRGAAARDVLASCCALDLHPRVFGPLRCAQTLLGKAPVLLSQMDDTPTYWILVRPSFAGYVVSWLRDGMECVEAESS